MPKLKIILQSKYFIGITLIFVCLYVLVFTKLITYKTNIDINSTLLEGEILNYSIDGDKLSLTIKSIEKVVATYYFTSLEEKNRVSLQIAIGAKIKLEGKYSIPYNNTIPNTFNYKKYLYNNKIYVTFQASDLSIINEVSLMNKIKNKFINKIEEIEGANSYLYAFVLGETDYIDNDVYQTYQKNGVTHLFAVSSSNISLLVLILNKFLQKMKVKEIICDIIVVLFLGFYVFMIGFSASVVRGSLLFVFLLINKRLSLKLDTIIVLYLVFLVLIIINPFYVYDLGFVYSFTTSLGLILFSKKIVGNYIMKLIKVSFIAFLFSMPITLYNFYEINLLTVINNIIIVPLVSVILFPLTILTFVFPFLDFLLAFGVNVLESLNEWLDKLSIMMIVPKVNMLFIIFYYLAIYLVYKKSWKYLLVIFMIIFIYKTLPYLDNNNYIYFLDVGQGDASLIVGNNRSYAIMVDTGGKVSYEKEEWRIRDKEFKTINNIITFLKSLGINKLDLLIVTHGDFDHIGEGTLLVNKFKVDKVIFNHDNYNDLELNFIKVLEKKKIKYYQNIDSLNIGDNEIYFLNYKMYDNENDNSNIIYVKLDNIKLLLMGDAGINVESDLLDKYKLDDISILKVGHHGSKTSSSKNFITNISPKYGVISVGKNNRYGHPNKEVLDNLDEAIIYRTDYHGTIVFKVKNNKLKINTCPP